MLNSVNTATAVKSKPPRRIKTVLEILRRADGEHWLVTHFRKTHLLREQKALNELWGQRPQVIALDRVESLR